MAYNGTQCVEREREREDKPLRTPNDALCYGCDCLITIGDNLVSSHANIQKILSLSILACLAPMFILLVCHKSLLYHDDIMSLGRGDSIQNNFQPYLHTYNLDPT